MKKKALILTILSSMTLAAGGLAVALSANQLGFIDSAAGEKVTGSILFSRETGEFTRIDEYTSSTSARTGSGATYYAIANSNADVQNTSYIAQFGSGRGGIEYQYISFSTNPNGGTDFQFQKITDIKIKSSANTTFYVYYGDGFGSSYSVSASSNPSKYTFSTPLTQLRVGVGSAFPRNVVSVELFYECGEEDPEPSKEIQSIAADFITGVKQNYVKYDTFEEAPIKVTYTDSTSEVITSGVTFTGYDMNVCGDYTVTASYQGFECSYKIFVKPSENAVKVFFLGYNVGTDEYGVDPEYFLDSSSNVPVYGVPTQTYTFTPVLLDGLTLLACDGDEAGVSITDNGDGSFSFTVPDGNVDIYIVYY